MVTILDSSCGPADPAPRARRTGSGGGTAAPEEKAKLPHPQKTPIQGLPPCGKSEDFDTQGATARFIGQGEPETNKLNSPRERKSGPTGGVSCSRPNPYVGSGFPESWTRTKSAVHSKTLTTRVIQDLPPLIVTSMERPREWEQQRQQPDRVRDRAYGPGR